MKNLLSIKSYALIAVFLLMYSQRLWSDNEDVIPSTVYYEISSDGNYAYVTGGNGTHLVIDDYYRGLPVRKINNIAFQGNKMIKTIKFPNTLKKIGDYAFSECQNLKSILLPDSIEYLGESAFGMYLGNSERPNVKSIIMPASLKTIMSGALECWTTEKIYIYCKNSNWMQNCLNAGSVKATQLKYLNISSIEDWCSNHLATFEECPFAYSSKDGSIIFNNIAFNGTLTIPEDVSYIGEHTFSRFAKLNKLIVSDGVRTILSGAFYGCENMTYAYVGDSVSVISDDAFENCSRLDTLIIGKSLKNFKAFTNCSSLKNIKISDDNPYIKVKDNSVVTKDGTKLLYVFGKKSKFVLPESISSIEVGAFDNAIIDTLVFNDNIVKIPTRFLADNKTIKSVVLGNSVKEIGAEAFKNTNLKNVVLPETLDSIGNKAFSNSMLEAVTIPSSVKYIPNYAFYSCSKLKNVKLNEGLVGIGDYAFCGCATDSMILPASVKQLGINSIGVIKLRMCSTTPPSLNDHLFYNFTLVLVPEGCKELYVQCPQWNQYTVIDTEKYLDILKNKGEKISDLLAQYADSYNDILGIKLKGDICQDDLDYIKNNLKDLFYIDFSDSNIEEISNENCLSDYHYMMDIKLGEKLKKCFLRSVSCSNNLVIPSTVEELYLYDVYMPVTFSSVIPPKGNYSTGDNSYPKDIFVPEASFDLYKKHFEGTKYVDCLKTIEHYVPKVIDVWDSLNVSNLHFESKPVLYVHDDGSFNYSGKDNLSFSQIRIDYSKKKWYESDNCNRRQTVISAADIITDKSLINIEFSTGKWTFFSLPYDVKVSDIITPSEESCWTIRRYNGENRANAKFDETWQDLGENDILKRNEGYAIHVMNSNDKAIFGFPSYEASSDNKGWLHTGSSDVNLNDYISESPYDLGWNLVSNPYTCYFDTRKLEYKSPITVWSEKDQTYQAYSPIDDNYVLLPCEAFFVQNVDGADKLRFDESGKMSNYVVKSNSKNMLKTGMTEKRDVFNIKITDGYLSDKARFVINNDIKSGYVLGYDAAKFESHNSSTAQIYIIDDNLKYAIKERPLCNGYVKIGVSIVNSGIYKIHLDTDSYRDAYLCDNLAGITVNLKDEDYEFKSETGTFNNRFLLRFDGETTDIQDINNSGCISISGRMLHIPENTQVAVYSLNGEIIKKMNNGGIFELMPGVYLVKHNGIVEKIMIE